MATLPELFIVSIYHQLHKVSNLIEAQSNRQY